ncbi:BamA/TamA family outer membrane protein [Psychrobacter frigidicola]|uniref:BamA/TamA family outer membrane protein n=1 Tax=Psychrobacter frigidicola TaxID=45611 RepID=A0A5C7A6T7_9GAMM|nr:BamA/TamA family outer membrane protein [Psychrobacter frigidicola]TXD98234.1 BamA/TamA family outer membrane protein [Psychrobacter frigidicola]
MSRQLLSPARNVSSLSTNQSPSRKEVFSECAHSRIYFARTALFTALTSSLVGFGITPALAAETNDGANSNVSNSSALSDAQLDTALDALRLKKAVDDGIIEQSVLDDYKKQNLSSNSKTQPKNQSNKKSSSDNRSNSMSSSTSNDNLQQQVASVQQQGYQMMTPAQIERELAAVNAANKQSSRKDNNSGFNAPVAMLDGRTTLIGLDTSLDAANLPAPNNLETLGFNDSTNKSKEARAENAEIMARPINVSDAVTSGRVDVGVDINQQANPKKTLAQQQSRPAIGAGNPNKPVDALNPEDYLPGYEDSSETQAVAESVKQGAKPKLRARNNGGFIKRTYNRLFNSGYMALPHVETTVYLQQDAASNAPNGTPKLIKADDDIQPINNIKAALDDTTVQSVVDFTAALPRLRQIAVDAAKAVGYYDITLRLRQTSSDTIDVIIEKLGEPVRVESHIVDIRGQGIEQAEFKALEKELPPKEGDIFNHRVYKDSKAALEALSSTYGYFDQYWLNKSVDIILPDNTADVSLVYNTGDRYQFDEVVFFTYDKESGTLTQDPDKLPVELSLLRQLYEFKAGDPFFRPDITKFSNDLSATRYFNTVNVETIVPPDELSETSTLAFDNAPTTDDNSGIDSDVSSDGTITTPSSSSNTGNENARGGSNSRSENDGNANTDADKNDDGQINASSGTSVDEADIAPIEFEVDEETHEKFLAIKQKAERLSRLPTDRVLDEKTRETDSILGKISDSISKVAKKVFPDEEMLIADETFVPPTLEGRKTPEQVQARKKVPLYVFVSADKPRDAQVGIGYGTDTGVRATGKVDYNLINRKGYQAGAEVAVSRINKNATIYGSRPWKHPLNDKLEARLTYEEETIDQGKGNFDLSTKTLKAALARNIHRDNGWDRSYFVRYRLDQLETGVDDAELEDLPVRFVSSSPKQQALLLGYGISKTTVDNAANPTRGYRQYYGIEAGADKAFSDTDLAIVRAGVSGIYSFGDNKKHQVLGSLNTGYIWADDFYDVPYKLRFFAGGDQSIRGYDYNSLSPIDKGYLTGGQILAVGSAEYNYEFKPGFRGAVFSDVGNAYDKDFNADTKVGVGVGIRWASPVGVVRVDVAAGVTEEDIPVRLHFFIGSPL